MGSGNRAFFFSGMHKGVQGDSQRTPAPFTTAPAVAIRGQGVIFSGVVAVGTVYLRGHALGWLLPLVAVWAGGMVGLLFNFTVSRRWVLARRTANSEEDL